MFHPDQEPKILGTPGVLYPPAFSIPCTQARKGGGQMEKTHNTEGLGAENISMFFSNSIANKKGFLPRPARFRAWTGAGREAGSYQGDAIRTIEAWWDSPAYTSVGGGCASNGNYSSGCYQTVDGAAYHTFGFDVSKAVPTAVENRPINVTLPVILYLGLPA